MTAQTSWFKTIQYWNGSKGSPTGLSEWWRGDDGIKNLKYRLKKYRNSGYHNFVHVLPGGHRNVAVEGKGIMPHDQFMRLVDHAELPPNRCNDLFDFIAAHIKSHQDEDHYLYMGWPPGTAAFLYEVGHWASLGFTGFILDYASHGEENPYQLIDYHAAMLRLRINVIGEKIPHNDNCRWLAPGLALWRDLEQDDPDHEWGGRRHYIGVSAHKTKDGRTTNIKSLARYLERGFTPVVFGDTLQYHDMTVAAWKEANG